MQDKLYDKLRRIYMKNYMYKDVVNTLFEKLYAIITKNLRAQKKIKGPLQISNYLSG